MLYDKVTKVVCSTHSVSLEVGARPPKLGSAPCATHVPSTPAIPHTQVRHDGATYLQHEGTYDCSLWGLSVTHTGDVGQFSRQGDARWFS